MKLEIITKTPQTKTHDTPLLLIHGAWHGAWCWENFLPYFADQGYEVHALSLRGHGASEGHENIRWYSGATDYVEDVAQVVNSLDRQPVLIGHSMGGYVTQKYLEQHNALAGVLVASIPVTGLIGMMCRLLIRHPIPSLKTVFLFDTWHLAATPALAKDHFFSDDYSDIGFSRHYARMQTESYRMALETLVLSLPRPRKVKTPLLVLSAQNDRTFSVQEQKATAKAYHTEAVFFPNMAHDMMLEKDWQKVADKILSWLGERGL